MPKPIIALPADIREFDGAVWHATPEQYVRAALKAADVMTFIIPAFENGNDTDAILDRVDGLLVSGSATNVRSEEHTSEHQSLMRISCAVFCLKKTKSKVKYTTRQTH